MKILLLSRHSHKRHIAQNANDTSTAAAAVLVVRAVAGAVARVTSLLAVPGRHVPVQVPLPDQHLAANLALVGGFPFCVKPDVLVQVARVAEGSTADLKKM